MTSSSDKYLILHQVPMVFLLRTVYLHTAACISVDTGWGLCLKAPVRIHLS